MDEFERAEIIRLMKIRIYTRLVRRYGQERLIRRIRHGRICRAVHLRVSLGRG